MNRDKIRERIRNGSIRDPVNAADGPPIYHATRSNGKPLRVAYYRHVKSDHLDTSIYYELETHCARQWISARTDWELKGVFLDTNGSWAAYEEMKAGKYDLIVARTISSFGRIFSDAAERIAELPFPVFLEAEGILSSDEKYQDIVNELIAEDTKRMSTAYLKDVLHIHGGIPSCSDVPPIMGHGNKFLIDSNRRKAKQCQDEFVEWAESIYEAIANYCEALYKDTNRIIAAHGAFFSNLSSVNEIICLGLSFGDVDIPYLERIASEVEPTTRWLVYYYGEESHRRLKDVFGILGISREFEVYFLPSDHFWDR